MHWLKANQQCINHDYYVGQHVLKYNQTIKGKYAVKISSPFDIVGVHVNGTITIQLQLCVIEHINVHHTIPCNKPLV